MGIATLFSLTFASYNSYKTISLKRDLIRDQKNLKAFLEKRLEVSEVEQKEMQKRIKSYTATQINIRLKKLISKERFEETQNKSVEEKRKQLRLTELEILQKRKLDNVQSILRDELTDKCIAFLDKHQVSMVESSNRSYVYKQRVFSRQGHLSNTDCLKLLDEILHPLLKHIHIAHISSECNSRKLLQDLFNDFLKKKNSKTQFSLTNQDIISKRICF